jgi:hypothetical protein
MSPFEMLTTSSVTITQQQAVPPTAWLCDTSSGTSTINFFNFGTDLAYTVRGRRG